MQEQDRPGFQPPEPGSAPEGAAGAVPGAPEVVAGTSRRRVSAGVVVAAVGIGALGIAGAAYAAASDPSPSPSGSSGFSMPGDRDGDGPHRDGMPGPGGHHGDGMRGPGMGIHGTFVVPQPDGSGYQTVHVQRGEVTAVSATSITVKSEDGYSKAYVVDAATEVNRGGAIADIAVGASVMVLGVAADDGGDVTATRIVDAATMPPKGDRDGDGDGPDDDDLPVAPSPAGTA